MGNFLDKKMDQKDFKEYLYDSLTKLQNKKVLIYGAGLAFEKLWNTFDLKELNIVAISDIKFTEEGMVEGIKAIPPSSINEYDIDVILMTLIYPVKAIEYLQNTLQLNETIEIINAWNEEIDKENQFLEYLEKLNFEDHLEKLSQKLKNKKVIIYGTGAFFQTINKYYDLSKLNIIAVSDKKFWKHEKGETFLNYPICSPAEINELGPSYVFVATMQFLNIIEDLQKNILKGPKIRTLPLIKKSFIETLKEIWA